MTAPSVHAAGLAAAATTEGSAEQTWTGEWVSGRLPADLRPADAPLAITPADLVGLALRRNPRRAHLLVSRVLGKHVPADPRLVYGTGLLLGELVRRALTGDPSLPAGPARLLREALAANGAAAGLPAAVRAAAPDPRIDVVLAYPAAVVLGFAETATGLGHAVADALREARYLHSTRRPVAGVAVAGGFDEEHSHAIGHLLLPADPALLSGPEPVVLVDDELSTGRTVLNTVAALQRLSPRRRYVVATLLDLRSAADRVRLARAADLLGTRIDVVALATGRLDLPPDAAQRGVRIAAAVAPPDPPVGPAELAPVTAVTLRWPDGVPLGGRHGTTPAHGVALDAALPAMAERLAAALLPPGPAGAAGAGRVLVLGTEELMYAPTRLGAALADLLDGPGGDAQVAVSSTTRSPVLAVDDPGYAVRTRLAFAAQDVPADGPGERYAYNVLGPGGERRFDAIVLVLDPAADTPALRAPGGLLDALRAATGRVVVAVLPERAPVAGPGAPPVVELAAPRGARPALPEPLRGPAFGSYAAAEVGWLLTDLSHVALERPLAEREAAVQSGRAHYAESLPVEYQPGPEYLELFGRALDESATRVAHAVGLVTEAVLARRGARAVLVSLARAGTPVGILMRRWAAQMTGLQLPHYAASIVRGRGIDTVALRWLAQNHDPADVVFVDGWTGKGAIARELRSALAAHAAAGGPRFCPDLAVLADPGCAAPMAGTREDFLVPSACLNSTVSGLVSRTVLRADLIGPGDFHGAKFYAELAPGDVSARFLDTVSARFASVAGLVAAETALGVALARPVTWLGWRAVERICAAEGIADANLVKPGVGETTRVLLRRVPWKVLVRAEAGEASGADADLAHVRMLAAERGVPVEVVPDLPFSCVGLIKPGAGGDS